MSEKDDLQKWAEIASDPDEKYKKTRDRMRNQDQRLVPKGKGMMASINQHRAEDEVIQALDDMAAIRRLAPTILKLTKKKMTLEQAIRDTSADSFVMLLKLAFSEGSDKVRADVLKHLLALAGHSPAQKHQIERVDPNTPKEALLAMISGAANDLAKEGITVEDDREDDEDQSEES